MDKIRRILGLAESLRAEKKPPRFAVPIARFAKYIRVDEDSGCWCWMASLNNGGYGNFNGTSAHRFIYQYVFGSIPADLQLDHVCRNRRCANPNHLEAVTAVENLMRGRRHCAGCRQQRCSKH